MHFLLQRPLFPLFLLGEKAFETWSLLDSLDRFEPVLASMRISPHLSATLPAVGLTSLVVCLPVLLILKGSTYSPDKGSILGPADDAVLFAVSTANPRNA